MLVGSWFYLVSSCALKNIVCMYVQYQSFFVGRLSLSILATLESSRTLVYRLHISLTRREPCVVKSLSRSSTESSGKYCRYDFQRHASLVVLYCSNTTLSLV